MKIKGFEFDLEHKEDDSLFSMIDQKMLELKLFDATSRESTQFTKDFKDLKDLLQNDPDRGRILSYLIYRGWRTILDESPLFNLSEIEELLRKELHEADL